MTIRYSDAMISGILASPYFNPPTSTGDFNFPNDDLDFGGDYNQSYTQPWEILFGYNRDLDPSGGEGGGLSGEAGKADPLDAYFKVTGNGYLSLSGSGATQSSVGRGRDDGQFGIGGGKQRGTTSCGGGGGWLGGGSGLIKGGGGGGSGFCLQEENEWLPEGYGGSTVNIDGEMTGTDLINLLLDKRQYIAVEPPTMIRGYNTGNGYVEIYTPQSITPIRFNYTGKVQTFTVPVTGRYRISCYGAQGGGDNINPDEKYHGGKGGLVSAPFEFEEGTVLFIYVGQRGQVQRGVNAWNGGGIGDTYMYGGGGGTDVRWAGSDIIDDWKTTLPTRFIVAGGGGAIGGKTPDFDDSSIGSIIDMDNGYTSDPNVPMTPDGSPVQTDPKLPPKYFLVNNKSKVTVDVLYEASDNLPESARLFTKLYKDVEKQMSLIEYDSTLIGEQVQPLQAGVNVVTFEFYLDNTIPVDLGSIWEILHVEFVVSSDRVPEGETDPNIILIIPPDGVSIKVSTPLESGESIGGKPPLPEELNLLRIEILNAVDTFQLYKQIPDPDANDLDALYEILNLVDIGRNTYYQAIQITNTEDILVKDMVLIKKESDDQPLNLDNLFSEIGVTDNTFIINRTKVFNLDSTESVNTVFTGNQVFYQYKLLTKIEPLTIEDASLLHFEGREPKDPFSKTENLIINEELSVFRVQIRYSNRVDLSILIDMVNRQKYDYKYLQPTQNIITYTDIVLLHRQ